jgi:hypothetical protein
MKLREKCRKPISGAERERRERQKQRSWAAEGRLLWSLDETAFKLSVHRQTVLNLIKRKKLRGTWIGKRHMVVADSARALIAGVAAPAAE